MRLIRTGRMRRIPNGYFLRGASAEGAARAAPGAEACQAMGGLVDWPNLGCPPYQFWGQLLLATLKLGSL